MGIGDNPQDPSPDGSSGSALAYDAIGVAVAGRSPVVAYPPLPHRATAWLAAAGMIDRGGESAYNGRQVASAGQPTPRARICVSGLATRGIVDHVVFFAPPGVSSLREVIRRSPVRVAPGYRRSIS